MRLIKNSGTNRVVDGLRKALGTYNPDWALLVEKDGAERLYFVVETKSSLFTDDLRDRESGKIKCGDAHFDALAVGENPAKFIKATKLDDVLART